MPSSRPVLHTAPCFLEDSSKAAMPWVTLRSDSAELRRARGSHGWRDGGAPGEIEDETVRQVSGCKQIFSGTGLVALGA